MDSTIRKVTMNFRSDSLEKLENIGKTFKRPTATDANAYAIDLANFFAEHVAKGEKIQIVDKVGQVRELVIPR